MNERYLNDLRNRFEAKTSQAGDCINWTGSNAYGYGHIWVDGRLRRATHVALFLATGEWPEQDKIVCHHCDNKSCVRVEHLYVGTQVENQRDTFRRGPSPVPKMNAAWRARTHCKNGHEYSTETIRIKSPGYRVCLLCERAWNRNRNKRNAENKLAAIDAFLAKAKQSSV